MSGSGDSGGSFEERLRAARRRQGLEAPPPGQTGGAGGVPTALGIGLRVGVELVAALAVAVAIGWWLDRWLGTRPVLLAVFVLLGGAAGVANVWRLMGPGRTPPGPKQD
jgi:ATP synthase protein I